MTLQIFDAAELVKLHCGKRNAAGDIDLEQSEGEIEEYGVNETVTLLQSASKMEHIKTFGLDFDRRMG